MPTRQPGIFAIGTRSHFHLELDVADASRLRQVIGDIGSLGVNRVIGIFRRSTPFGTVETHGLLFVAFSADQRRVDRMLARMAGVEDGVRDRLTSFSTPVSGAYYVVPPLEAL